jgi:hypothetical protein
MLVADHLQPAARKAGLAGQVGFHTLRRSLASALVANGSDIRLVQELLRHSNPLITLDAYARSTTPAKIEAQGWVMEQLLTEDWKAALAAANPRAQERCSLQSTISSLLWVTTHIKGEALV